MKDEGGLPQCSNCEAPIFKERSGDLFRVSCGCRQEILDDDESFPTEWSQ